MRGIGRVRHHQRFAAYSSEVRPAPRRKTPQEVYTAREKDRPSSEPIDLSGVLKFRHDKLDKKGKVTLRINGQMDHIPYGRSYAGWRVRVPVDDLDIQVIGVDTSPLRRLAFDPTSNYQSTPRVPLTQGVYNVSRGLSPMSCFITLARGGGLEPPITGPEPAVLPITPPPNGRGRG